MLGKGYPGQDCNLARALEMVGERWTLLILRDAFYGVQRFSDFVVHLDIPRAVLSDRLAGLVEHALMTRTPDLDSGRDRYELTEGGRAVWPALHALTRFGDQFAPGSLCRIFRHESCGTQLEPDGHCAVCGVTPDPEQVTAEPAAGLSKRDDPVSLALRRKFRLLTPLEQTAASA